MGQDRVELVERALSILDVFRQGRKTMTLAELAQATGLYKSTILRIAGSLERFGYLRRSEDGTYRLGPAVGRLGTIYRAGFDLADVIRPELAGLVDATGETASFYVPEGDRRLCLYRHNSPHAMRHHLEEGVQLPLNGGASARIITAYRDPETPDLAAIIARGYYVSLGERDPHIAAVSVPVLDAAGIFHGALAISGLITRFDAAACDRAVALLADAAARIGRAIS